MTLSFGFDERAPNRKIVWQNGQRDRFCPNLHFFQSQKKSRRKTKYLAEVKY